MSFDGHANFALGTIVAAPTPSGSGLVFRLKTGQGALFSGSAPFNCTVWPSGIPLKANAEIVRVEKIEGDTITLSGRAEEGTSAKQIESGWLFADTITVKNLTDVEKAVESETARAIAAEATKASASGLTAEISARETGDSTNATAITSEKARAEGAEATKATTTALTTETSAREAADLLKAPLASPAFTGTPTAPTPTMSDNSTKLATTAFAKTLKTEAEAASIPKTLAGIAAVQPFVVDLPENHGAVRNGVTDDTAAIKSAINNAVTLCQENGTNYCEVWFSAGIYAASSATVKGGSTLGNAQIPLPVISPRVQKVTLVLRAVTDGSSVAHWHQLTPQSSAAVVETTLTGLSVDGTWGAPSIIGGPTKYVDPDGAPSFSNMLIVNDGVTLLAPINPGIIGMDFRQVAEANVPNMAALVKATPTELTGNLPTNGLGIALYMPGRGNNDNCNVGILSVEGWCYGLGLSEHLVAQRVLCVYTNVGVYVSEPNTYTHGATIQYLSVEASKTALEAAEIGTGRHFPINIGMLDVEEISGSYHIIDVQSALSGIINYVDGKEGTAPRINGGSKLQVFDLNQSPVYASIAGLTTEKTRAETAENLRVSAASTAASAAQIPISESTTRAITWQSKIVIDARDYGVTVNGGVDATTALQNAINAASTAKGAVELPAGTIRLAGALTIKSNVELRGQGAMTLLEPVYAEANHAAVITNELETGNSNITLRNFRLSRAGSNVQHGILLNGVSNLNVDGVEIVGVPSVTSGALAVSGVLPGGSGATLQVSKDVRVRGCLFESANNFGIQLSYVTNATVSGCVFDNCYREAVGVEPQTGCTATNVSITGNTFTTGTVPSGGSATGVIVVTTSSGGTLAGVSVSGNTLTNTIFTATNTQPGINVLGINGDSKVTITANMIVGMNGNGISIGNASIATGGVVISGNYISQCNEGKSIEFSGAGISLRQAFRCTITGNYIDGNHHTASIYESQSGAGRNLIIANHLLDTVAMTLLANGNTLARDNYGKATGSGGRLPVAANYTMLVTDTLIAVTSTSAAREITSLAANALPAGVVYTITDESNAAGTNHIIFKCAGADTFTDGTKEKTINTNNGSLKFYSTGEKLQELGGNVSKGELEAINLRPSGDETGKTDTEKIKKLLEEGGCRLGYGVFWYNESFVVPDGTSGTKANGFLLGLGEDQTIIRQTANTNLATPAVSTSNWWNGEGVDSTDPVHISGLTIDVNVGSQTYASMPETNTITGPDGLVVFNNQCDVSRIKVANPARHGIIVADQTKTGKNATGKGYDCNFDNLRVDGYYVNGTSPTIAVAATTESSKEVTTSESVAEVKIGMVVAGSNIAPNTVVSAITSGKITISQNALATGTVKLWFGWGQRGFWSSNLSGNGCNDSFLTECVVRNMWGDYAIKVDNCGDWFTKKCHTYASSWSGAQFTFCNTATITENGFDNIGQAGPTDIGASVPFATTEGGWSGGQTLKVKALPVAIPQFTPLVLRTAGPGGGPLYIALSKAAAAGATSISVFNVTANGEVPTGTILYRPLVGLHVVEGAQTSAYSNNRSQQKEIEGADYLYLCFIGFATSGHATNIDGNRPYNESTVNGATSTGELYISSAAEYENVVAPEGQKIFTLSGAKQKGFINGAEVIFFTVGGVTLPKAGTTYYVINALSNEFELSETKGGSAITVAGAPLPSTALMALQSQVWSIYGASTNTTKGRGLITTTFQANGRNEGPYSAIRTITSAIRNIIEFVDGAPGSSSLAAGNHFSFIAEGTTKSGEVMIPVTGWWRMRAAGGGGQGGGGGSPATNVTISGGGGGAAGIVGEQIILLQAGEVLKYQAGAGGSGTGEGATAGAGGGKGGSSGSRSFWENNAATILYAEGLGGGAGGAGGTSASAGGIPGGKNSSALTVPGGGGIGLLGGNGEVSGAPFGAGGLGGGGGGGGAISDTLGGTGGKAGWSYLNGTTNTGSLAAGGEAAKSATKAGENGENAANGTGAGGGGGGAGAYDALSQGAGGNGGVGGSGWCDLQLVG